MKKIWERFQVLAVYVAQWLVGIAFIGAILAIVGLILAAAWTIMTTFAIVVLGICFFIILPLTIGAAMFGNEDI